MRAQNTHTHTHARAVSGHLYMIYGVGEKNLKTLSYSFYPMNLYFVELLVCVGRPGEFSIKNTGYSARGP